MNIKVSQLLMLSFLALPLINPQQSNAQSCQDVGAAAQADCEAKNVKNTWHKGIFAGFNLTQGNSENVLLNVGGSANADFGDDIYRIDGLFTYGENTDIDTDIETETQNNVRLDGSWKHLIDDRWYYGAGANFLHDDIADVNYRVIVKPALGYFWLKEEDKTLSVEAGPGVVFEDVGGIDEIFFAPFIGDRFDWIISDNAKLYQLAEVIFDTSSFANKLITAEVGIEAAISNDLSLVVSVRNIHDTRPAEGRDENDLSIISSLKMAL